MTTTRPVTCRTDFVAPRSGAFRTHCAAFIRWRDILFTSLRNHMDSKANLYESMMHAISTMGGSHLTQDARTRTAERFVDKIHDGGFTNVCDTSEIKGAELRYYIDERVADGVPTCTIQNEVAYLCAILRAVGKFTVADAPEFSSKALGITGGSRLGTKTAMTEEQLANLVELACHQGKPGIAAVLKLEYYLGLCVNEAIHGCGDTLERWLTELRSTGSVLVRVGTKYGKQRKVISKNVGAATEAVEYALPIAKRQNGFLIDRADGKPSTDLKTAHLLYRSWASRAGVTPNAARYAFARAQVQGYVSEGMSEQEAIWAASLDLGHGDGRSRWQKSVYLF